MTAYCNTGLVAIQNSPFYSLKLAKRESRTSRNARQTGCRPHHGRQRCDKKTNVTAFQSTRISIDRTPARPTQDAVCRHFISMQGEAAPPIAAYMQTQDMQKERAVHFSKLRGRGISSNRPFCEICGAINISTPRNVVSATRLLARAKHVLSRCSKLIVIKLCAISEMHAKVRRESVAGYATDETLVCGPKEHTRWWQRYRGQLQGILYRLIFK